jgi:multiple antibiotic resistance protein
MVAETIMEILQDFILAFIPLFVAFDVIGILPIFLNFTKALSDVQVKQVVLHSTFTALIIGLIFLFIGNGIFTVLGITVHDFRIAGGLVLLLVSITDIMGINFKSDREEHVEVGVVPIGMPLILGPAALTTVVMLGGSLKWGYMVLPVALFINLVIVFIVFRNGRRFARKLGPAISAVFSKVMGLLIVAYAIMMIRVGILASITEAMKK